MNMISTGAFLNEMDASNKQPTVAEKFAAVWEKKNAKAARAGGVSLMALSLAACGSSSTSDSSSSTDTTTTTTPATAASFDLTPLDDIASGTQALNGSLASEFRFTDGNEVVNALTATIATGDVLLDTSGSDADVMNITVTGDMAKMSAVDIETVNVTFASGSDASARMSNFSGMDTLNVTGSVAGVVEDAGKATIAVADYGRTLTVDVDSLAGTTTLGNAEEMNLSVSGGTYGTTASTQTTLALTVQGSANATDGVLETLNITSTGSAANVFALSTDADMSLSKINITGDQAATIRVAEGDVTGNTIAATSTGAVRLSLDANSSGATPLNAANWTGLDAIEIRDSATSSATDAVRVNSAADGTKLVIKNSVGTTELSVQGTSRTSQAEATTLELNGSSTTAGVTVGQFGSADYGQNIAGLNIVSTGLASSTSTTAANTITTLIGDQTTVTITGDTSLEISTLDIDPTQTATSTSARTVTVDASAMTGNAFVKLTAGTDTKVTYDITGTDGADTLIGNTTGSTLTGNGGNDTITTYKGVDTVDAGAGNDHIDISYGADTVTGGAGNDTYDVDVKAATAVTEKQTITVTAGSNDVSTADEDFVVNVNGEIITWTHDESAATNVTLAADELEAALKLSDGFLNGDFTIAQSAGELTLTFDADLGDIDDITFWQVGDDASTAARSELEGNATNGTTFTSADVANYTGSAALDVDTDITDFADGDILDVSDILASSGAYHEGAAGDAAAGDSTIVLTSVAYASATDATNAVDINTSSDDGIIVYLNSVTGMAEVAYDADTDDATNGSSANVLFVLENITTLTDLAAAFDSDTFVV